MVIPQVLLDACHFAEHHSLGVPLLFSFNHKVCSPNSLYFSMGLRIGARLVVFLFSLGSGAVKTEQHLVSVVH
jgi:hypothetical protein